MSTPSLCMIVHAYYPLNEPRVQREARAAHGAGFDVTVLALRGKGEPARETVDGIRVRRLPMDHRRGAGIGRMLFEYLGFWALSAAWLAARTVRRRFDIVHFHNPPDFLIFGGLLARIRGSRLVLDVHDLSPHMFRARLQGRVGAAVSRTLVLLERAACRLADVVITVHDPYRRELVADGVLEPKIRVVMNSIDDALLERARSLAGPASASGGFTVAYHGTLAPWYGTDILVEAVASLRREGLGVGAMILGDGDAVPELRRMIAAEGLEQHVELPGRYLPIEEALAAVRSAQCGVIPNRPSEINRFALSSKLFEYVALGIPVVVARLETLAAHFSPEEVTFFEPGDASGLAAAVRWVYEHPDEARSKAQRAQVRAQQYSWARGRDELLGIYAGLLSANGRAAHESALEARG